MRLDVFRHFKKKKKKRANWMSIELLMDISSVG